MPRTKLPTEIRRDQIAEAVLALVSEHGFGQLGVAEVAHRVGIAPSALYRHFPGKEAMLDTVIERMAARLHALVPLAEDGAADAIDALRRLIGLHLELIRGHRAFFAVLVNDAFHSGAPDRRARVHAVLTGYLQRVAAVVARGQREGTIRDDVPAARLAGLFFGLVQPGAMLWVLSGGASDIHRPAREAWPLFEQLVRAPRAAHAAGGAARARRHGRAS